MKRLSVVAAAAVVLVVLMHPGGGSTLDISPLVSCLPDCTGVADGGKVIDPFSCSHYYYCMSGLPANDKTECDPSTNIFNPDVQKCEDPASSSYTCDDPLCPPEDDGCLLSCGGPSLFLADVTDCSSYYICSPSGKVGPYKCPGDLPYFDGTNCVKDGSVCCTGYCEPYCKKEAEIHFTPDPKDCKKCYLCEKDFEGTPGDGVHFTCLDGQIFDVATLQCISGDANSCVTLCDAALGNGGDGGGGGGGGGSSGCVSSLTCPGAGNYAACDTCTTQYFECGYTGAAGVASTCPSGTLFNPNPQYAFCVREANCPYP